MDEGQDVGEAGSARARKGSPLRAGGVGLGGRDLLCIVLKALTLLRTAVLCTSLVITSEDLFVRT